MAPSKRSGFSLLEMVLALFVGTLLLLALYGAFTTYIMSAQTGRDAVTEATIARNVLARVSLDIMGQIGPDDARVVDYPGTDASQTTANANNSSGNNMNTPAVTQTMVKFNRGVFGEKDKLILSGYRVRKPPAVETDKTSDMTRTFYWIMRSGPKSMGLARAEIKQATANDVDLDPTTLTDPKYIIAPEVKEIEFSYNDGRGGWQDTWDGETPVEVGVPAPGPPAAIKIVLTIRRNLKTADDPDGDSDGPTYTQIIALPTSNSFPPATSNP
jgi:prepilin-type N-terminal cleavage/methylation domain-containing protein